MHGAGWPALLGRGVPTAHLAAAALGMRMRRGGMPTDTSLGGCWAGCAANALLLVADFGNTEVASISSHSKLAGLN